MNFSCELRSGEVMDDVGDRMEYDELTDTHIYTQIAVIPRVR